MGRRSGVLSAVACAGALVAAQYRRGDGVALECALDPPQLGDGKQITWKLFPVCFETDLPLELRYGKDQAMYCGLEIDAALFSWMQAAVTVQDCLQCRVAVAPEQQLYLPMCWPVWGAKDAEHLHVNNRFDFVLYADRGLIVGGGVFPVKGHFQFVKEGQVLNLHGAVRWLDVDPGTSASSSDLKHIILTPPSSSSQSSPGSTTLIAILCAVCASLFVLLCYYFAAYQRSVQYKLE